MAEGLNDLFLPYPPSILRGHFVDSDAEDEDPDRHPDRHLTRWRRRLEEAPRKDPSFLHRDETLWTAGALLAVHHGANRRAGWRAIMETVFGGRPPTPEGVGWDDLLGEDLELFFEVGLSSPRSYRVWLSEHLADRQALVPQRAAGEAAGLRLEGRTHLDALLISQGTGLAVHFEAKVLSDIDTKTKHDSLRNQLARNIDCMAEAEHALLESRDIERRFLVLLTPELFRRKVAKSPLWPSVPRLPGRSGRSP